MEMQELKQTPIYLNMCTETDLWPHSLPADYFSLEQFLQRNQQPASPGKGRRKNTGKKDRAT